MEMLQTFLAFLSPITVALIGLLQANWRKKDHEDAEKYRERMRLEEEARKQEQQATAAGVRSLLRSAIVELHHKCVGQGWASTAQKEVLQRDYDAYRGLNGNGVAVSLYDEVMELPTKD
jgi:hypothetical protein